MWGGLGLACFLWRCAPLGCRAGSPPRRAGNFHLAGPNESHQSKGPECNTMHSHRCASSPRPSGRSIPAEWARTTCSSNATGPLRETLEKVQEQPGRCVASPSALAPFVPVGSCLRSRYSVRFGPKQQVCGFSSQHGAHRPPAGPPSRSSTVRVHGVLLKALCFGDFHLGQPNESYPPAGADSRRGSPMEHTAPSSTPSQAKPSQPATPAQ